MRDEIENFRIAVDQEYDARGPDGIPNCQNALSNVVDSGALIGLINMSLAKLLESPNSDSASWLDVGIYITGGPDWTLRAVVYDRPASGIYTFPYVALIRNVGPHRYIYKTYDLPPNYINENFRKDAEITLSSVKVMSPGSVAVIDGRTCALDVEIDKPAVALRLYAHLPDVLQWRFSRDSLLPDCAYANKSVDSELVSLATAAGALRSSSAASVLMDLSYHQCYFVRWEAIKNLAIISQGAILERLHVALEDPHPEIRDAARKTLEKIAAGAR
jgi:hypothetical protein